MPVAPSFKATGTMLRRSASNIATSAIPGRYEKPSRRPLLPDSPSILHGLPLRHFHFPPLPAHVYQPSQNNRLQLAQARPLDDYHLLSILLYIILLYLSAHVQRTKQALGIAPHEALFKKKKHTQKCLLRHYKKLLTVTQISSSTSF